MMQPASILEPKVPIANHGIESLLSSGKTVIQGQPAAFHQDEAGNVFNYTTYVAMGWYRDVKRMEDELIDSIPPYDTIIWRARPTYEYFNRVLPEYGDICADTDRPVVWNFVIMEDVFPKFTPGAPLPELVRIKFRACFVLGGKPSMAVVVNELAEPKDSE